MYSSTKAALHSYSQSLRFKLRNTRVRALQVIPPWVRTELLSSSEESRAMPLDEFLQETMEALATDGDEIMVARAKFLRYQAGPPEMDYSAERREACSNQAITASLNCISRMTIVKTSTSYFVCTSPATTAATLSSISIQPSI